MPKDIVKIIGKKITPDFLKPFIRDVYHKVDKFLRYGDIDFFSAVDFENITACNRRCSNCPNSIYERGLLKNMKLMNEGLFKKIINELAEIKFSGMISPVFYGEPLLDKRLTGWMQYIREKLPKANISIFTNGDFLTFDLYKQLIQVGVDLFRITEYEEGISKNMKELLKNFHEVNCPDDYSYDIAYAFEGDKATILYKDIKKSKKLYNRGGLLKHLTPPKNSNPKCFLPSGRLTINYAGDVILCCNDYFGTIKFGNLKNESILEIWRKENFKKIRKELKKGIIRLEICKKCKGIE